MILHDKNIWEESPDKADVYRQRYVDGCLKYIKRMKEESNFERHMFALPEKMADNPVPYRKMYKKMLGIDVLYKKDENATYNIVQPYLMTGMYMSG